MNVLPAPSPARRSQGHPGALLGQHVGCSSAGAAAGARSAPRARVQARVWRALARCWPFASSPVAVFGGGPRAGAFSIVLTKPRQAASLQETLPAAERTEVAVPGSASHRLQAAEKTAEDFAPLVGLLSPLPAAPRPRHVPAEPLLAAELPAPVAGTLHPPAGLQTQGLPTLPACHHCSPSPSHSLVTRHEELPALLGSA